jgi:hypothetical protein
VTTTRPRECRMSVGTARLRVCGETVRGRPASFKEHPFRHGIRSGGIGGVPRRFWRRTGVVSHRAARSGGAGACGSTSPLPSDDAIPAIDRAELGDSELAKSPPGQTIVTPRADASRLGPL